VHGTTRRRYTACTGTGTYTSTGVVPRNSRGPGGKGGGILILTKNVISVICIIFCDYRTGRGGIFYLLKCLPGVPQYSRVATVHTVPVKAELYIGNLSVHLQVLQFLLPFRHKYFFKINK
jgi:hypothetical protein